MEILRFPNAKLLTVCEPVTVFGPELTVLLEKMYDTMLKAKGIGLAANQVGLQFRMFVMNVRDDRHFIVNPEILSASEVFANLKEGCLSAPGDFVVVNSRLKWVELKYQDETGAEKTKVFEDIFSVCVQHEIDHLNGKAFLQSAALSSKVRKQLSKKWGLV